MKAGRCKSGPRAVWKKELKRADSQRVPSQKVGILLANHEGGGEEEMGHGERSQEIISWPEASALVRRKS